MSQITICQRQTTPHFDTPREMREQIMRGSFILTYDQLMDLWCDPRWKGGFRTELNFRKNIGPCSDCGYYELHVEKPGARRIIADQLYPVPLHPDSQPLFEVIS